MNSRTFPSRQTRTGGAKKIILTVLVVLIVLVVALVALAPTLASKFGRGIAERTVNDGIAGKIAIDGLSLSWSGPQVVGPVRLLDPTGAEVGRLDVSAAPGLWGLATGSMNLGELKLSGKLDVKQVASTTAPGAKTTNLQEALRSTKPAPVPTPGSATPGQPGGAGKPGEIRLPANLAAKLNLDKLDVTYTGELTPGSGVRTVGLKDLIARGDFVVGKPVTLTASASTLDGAKAIDLTINADNITDSTGLLTLDKASADLKLDATIPSEYLDLIAASSGATAISTAAKTADEPLRAGATLKLKDGRLTLADPARPAFVEARVPAPLFAAAAGSGSKVSVEQRPKVSLYLEKLDMPVPIGRTTAPDYRGGAIKATIRSTETTGSLQLPGDNAAKRFEVRPFEMKFGTDDLAGGIGLIGEIKSFFAGEPAGSLLVDVVASNLLDSNGAPRAAGPGVLRGKFVLDKVPTALLQPIASGYDLDLAQVLGPTVAMDLRTGLIEAGAPSGSAMAGAVPPPPDKAATGAAPSPYVSGTIVSDKTRVYLDLSIDADRIRSRNEGIKVDTKAFGYLARHFAVDAKTGKPAIPITGEGLALLYLTDFEVPGIGTGGNAGLDLTKAKANVRVTFGDVTVTAAPDAKPLGVDSIDTGITFEGLNTPLVQIDHRLTYEGQKFGATGSIKLPGLLARDDKAPGKLGINLAAMRPEGTIDIKDVPSALAELGGASAKKIAAAAVGSKFTLKLEAKPGDKGASNLKLALGSDGTTGAGEFTLADGHIRTVAEGLKLTVNRPGDVLAAVGSSGPQSVKVDANTPLMVTLKDLDATLPETGKPFDAGAVASKLGLQTGEMAITVVAPGGAVQRINLSGLNALAATDAKGGADLTLDSKGAFDGKPFGISGTLGSSNVLTASGIDIRKLTPRGSIKLTDVPTSLVALVSPENAQIVSEVAGPSVNAQIAALTGGTPGIGFNLTGQNVAAKSVALIKGDALTVGPTEATATISPAAMAAVMAAKAPDLNPRPSLAAPAKLTITATDITLPILGPTQLDTHPRGVFRAVVKADNDVIVNNAFTMNAGLPSQKLISAGVREFGVAAVLNGPNAQTEINFGATLFDPAAPREMLAKLTAIGSLPLTTGLREASLDAPSTAALDRWLGTADLAQLAVGDSIKVTASGSNDPQVGKGTIITTNVDSPKLRTSVQVRQSETGTDIAPFEANWELDPKLAERFLFAGEPGKPPVAKLLRPAQLKLDVSSGIALGPADRLLDPSKFRANVKFGSPEIALATADGVAANLGQVQGQVKSQPASNVLDFNLSTTGVSLANDTKGSAAKPLQATGTVAGLADATGKLTPGGWKVTSKITGGLPTPLIDALSGQKGALVDLLGAGAVQTKIDTRDLSATAGQINADLVADNAHALAAGTIGDGKFTAQSQVRAELSRISPEASARFLSSILPFLQKVEKTTDDKPSIFTADNLTAPLDGDMRKLNGDLMFDLGTVRFQSSDFFGKVLSTVGGKSFGQVGRKIAPFKATAREGVINYEKITIPAGEFEISSRGKVDLVQKKMDLILDVPLLALAEEITGALKSVPLLSNVTTVPIRLKGPLDSPSAEPDIELLLKELPGKALGGGKDGDKGGEDPVKAIGDLLKGLGGKKKK